MRKKIVAGNWKMNLTYDQACELAEGVNSIVSEAAVSVALFPGSLYLDACRKKAPGVFQIGAQNAYLKDFGAYTGEISMAQLAGMGIKAVLIGHSERREYFGETAAILKEKVDAALVHGIQPYFCCGEPLDKRESGDFRAYVQEQLEASVFHLEAAEFKKIVIAYEPIWAIGTGKTATTEQAEEMHEAIRSWIAARYGTDLAEEISILYGGSCNPGNAKALFACPNVDGGLIGGASLKLEDFKILVAKETWTI